MSQPGDPGRRMVWAEGFDEIVVKVVELAHTVPGAHSFELRYAAMDRVLGDDEEPRPDEVVQWTASMTARRRYYPGAPKVTRTYSGEALVEPGGSHHRGMVLACVAMLEELGVNVVLLEGLAGGDLQ